MTTIQIISDIHTEFGMSLETFSTFFTHTDITILAGDIVDNAGDLAKYLQVVKEYSTYIIFVPGNHEFYNSSEDDDYERVCKEADVFYLQKGSISMCGINFCGATLWSDVTDFAIDQMNDPHDGEWIRNAHRDHLSWLENNIQRGDIVITHHLPSLKLIHEKYKGDTCTSGFATNLDHLIEKCAPSHWICGHTHVPFDLKIFDTRVIINPVGYPIERKSFTKKIITIPNKTYNLQFNPILCGSGLLTI